MLMEVLMRDDDNRTIDVKGILVAGAAPGLKALYVSWFEHSVQGRTEG